MHAEITDIEFDRMIDGLKAAMQALELMLPFAVCWKCDGVKAAGCSVCQGRGFLSEFFWKHHAPDDVKKARPIKTKGVAQ